MLDSLEGKGTNLGVLVPGNTAPCVKGNEGVVSGGYSAVVSMGSYSSGVVSAELQPRVGRFSFSQENSVKCIMLYGIKMSSCQL